MGFGNTMKVSGVQIQNNKDNCKHF